VREAMSNDGENDIYQAADRAFCEINDGRKNLQHHEAVAIIQREIDVLMEAKDKRIAELEVALEPFANWNWEKSPMASMFWIERGNKAKAALSGQPSKGKENEHE